MQVNFYIVYSSSTESLFTSTSIVTFLILFTDFGVILLEIVSSVKKGIVLIREDLPEITKPGMLEAMEIFDLVHSF